jgi:hypothetical protein
MLLFKYPYIVCVDIASLIVAGDFSKKSYTEKIIMANQTLSEKDPSYHTQNVGRMFEDLIKHLREDIDQVDDPQAKALFEVSAEVLQGLHRAFEHFETKTEKAWR